MAQFRVQATAVCRAARRELKETYKTTNPLHTGDIGAVSATIGATPLRTYKPSQAVVAAMKLAEQQALRYMTTHSKQIDASIKATLKAELSRSLDPSLATVLTEATRVLRSEYVELKKLQPPKELAGYTTEALADEHAQLGTYSSLLRRAKARKLTEYSFGAQLTAAHEKHETQETALWNKIGLPICNPDANSS